MTDDTTLATYFFTSRGAKCLKENFDNKILMINCAINMCSLIRLTVLGRSIG